MFRLGRYEQVINEGVNCEFSDIPEAVMTKPGITT